MEDMKTLGIDENEVAEMIYEKICCYWNKFPNLWEFVTQDDMATQVAMDLYRPRKADGVPHIIHYYNTRGTRSLKPLIATIAYRVLQAEARDIYSTSVFDNADRRNVYSALSLEKPIGGMDSDESVTLGDTITNKNVNVSSDIDYIMLYDSLPDKIVDNVYYKVGENYIVVSYKSLLKSIMDGYNISQIGENLYKLGKNGSYCKFRDTSSIIKEMKQSMADFFSSEYNFDQQQYENGGRVL